MNDFSSNDTDISLAGIGIVDGFTSPIHTAQELGNYAYNLGMIDYQERNVVEKELLKMTFAINNENWDRAHDLFDNTFDKVS